MSLQVEDVRVIEYDVRTDEMLVNMAGARLLELNDTDGAYDAEVEVLDINYPVGEKVQLYMNKVLASFEQYAKLSHQLAFDNLMASLKVEDPDHFSDVLAAHIMVSTTEKQSLLELVNPYERLQRLQDLIDMEIEKINIDKRINVQVKKQMEKAQKEYYLNEKVKAIHDELGRKDDRADERDQQYQRRDLEGHRPLAEEGRAQVLERDARDHAVGVAGPVGGGDGGDQQSDQQQRGEGRDGPLGAHHLLRHVVGAGEHEGEEEQDGDGAAVDEHLHQRQELRRQQDVDAGHRQQRFGHIELPATNATTSTGREDHGLSDVDRAHGAGLNRPCSRYHAAVSAIPSAIGIVASNPSMVANFSTQQTKPSAVSSA